MNPSEDNQVPTPLFPADEFHVLWDYFQSKTANSPFFQPISGRRFVESVESGEFTERARALEELFDEEDSQSS